MANIRVDTVAKPNIGAHDDLNSHKSPDEQPIEDSIPEFYCYHGNANERTTDLKMWVLVVHYNFKGTGEDDDRSLDVKADLKKLKSLFKKEENCKFKDISPPKNELLELFSQENKIQQLFDETPGGTEPDIFVIFISTHGHADGQLTTDRIDPSTNENERFHLSDILNKNLFESKLKLVFVAACRGRILEKQSQMEIKTNLKEIHLETVSTKIVSKETPCNKNAVRMTLSPNAINWIITYSNVETTKGCRDGEGTFLVQAFAKCISELKCDVDLAVFLTRVSRHAEDKNKEYGVGVTVEAKFFRHPTYADLKICRVPRTENDNLEQLEEESFVYNYTSEIGVPLKGGYAHFYCNCEALACECSQLQNELKTKLAFDIVHCKTLNKIEESTQRENANAAILICIVTKLSVNEENNLQEIYADMIVSNKKKGGSSIQAIPVKEILYNLIPASTTNYVGKPKVCIFLNKDEPEKKPGEETRVYMDFAEPTRVCRSGTMHSGLISLILPQKDATGFFTTQLSELSVDADTSYQQLFYNLLQLATKSDIGIARPGLGVNVQPCGSASDIIEGGQPSTSAQFTSSQLTSKEPIQSLSFAMEPQYVSTAPLLFNIQYPKPITTRFNIEKNGSKNTIDDLEKLVQAITDQSSPSIWLIHSLPEVGKSYLMNYLDKKLKNKRSITFINVFEDIKFLQDEETRFDCAKTFIQNFHKEHHIEREVLENEMVIIDDFDAADNRTMEKFIKLLPDFIKKKYSVFIGTRSHEKLRILTDLGMQENIICLEIKSWTSEEQDVLFRRCLGNENNFDQQKLRFRQWQAEDLKQSPWILRKIAAKLRASRGKNSPDTTKDDNLFLFCNDFLHERVKDVMEGPRLGNSESIRFQEKFKRLMKGLRLCALVYFAKEDSRNEEFFGDKKMVKKINHVGIFSIEDKKIRVLSESLAKYLAFEALRAKDFDIKNDRRIKFKPVCFNEMKSACEIMTNHYAELSEKDKDKIWALFEQNSAIHVCQPNIFNRCYEWVLHFI